MAALGMNALLDARGCQGVRVVTAAQFTPDYLRKPQLNARERRSSLPWERPQSFREIIKGSRHKDLIHGLIQGMGCCGNRKEQGNGADSRSSPHDGPGH